MKLILTTAVVLITMCSQTFARSVEFLWTPVGGSIYNANIQYSGGTIENGVFTPTGLVGYSFGSPFGDITPARQYPGFTFFTDTSFGPSFQIQGVIEPILNQSPANPVPPNQTFWGNNLSIYFEGQTEIIDYIQNGNPLEIDLTGTWTEIATPDTTNTGLLFGAALGALGFFHAAHRRKLAS